MNNRNIRIAQHLANKELASKGVKTQWRNDTNMKNRNGIWESAFFYLAKPANSRDVAIVGGSGTRAGA